MKTRILLVTVIVAAVAWLSASAVRAECGGGGVVAEGKEYKRFAQYVEWSE